MNANFNNMSRPQLVGVATLLRKHADALALYLVEMEKIFNSVVGVNYANLDSNSKLRVSKGHNEITEKLNLRNKELLGNFQVKGVKVTLDGYGQLIESIVCDGPDKEVKDTEMIDEANGADKVKSLEDGLIAIQEELVRARELGSTREEELIVLKESNRDLTIRLKDSNEECEKIKLEAEELNKEVKISAKEKDDLVKGYTAKDMSHSRKVAELGLEVDELKSKLMKSNDFGYRHDTTVFDGNKTFIDSGGNKSKLDSRTPVFNGNNMKVSDWLFLVENQMLVDDVPADKKLRLLAQFLRGTALNMLKRQISKGNSDWNDFKEVLIKTFQAQGYERSLRTKLLNLKQTDSFEKYSSEFQYICSQLGSMSDVDLLACFMQGLKPRTRLELILQEVSDLPSAIILASKFEMAMKEANLNGEKTSKYANNKPVMNKKITCYNCKEDGHYKNACPKMNGGKQTSRPDSKNMQITCYNCKEKGHKSSDCRKRKMVKSNLLVINMVYTREDSITSKWCHMRHVSTGTPLTKLDVVCAFDTGASASFISLDTVKKYDLCMRECPTRYKTADGLIKSVLGIVHDVEIIVEQRSCFLDLVVIDHKDHDLLLGCDWFGVTRAGIIPSCGKLTWTNEIHEPIQEEDEEIYLTSIEKYLQEDDDDLFEQADWHNERKQIGFKPAVELSESDLKVFNDLILKNKELFASSLDELDKCDIRPHQIKLNSDQSFYIRPYRQSEADRKEIKTQVDKMLANKICRKSYSPYSSPVILVNKPNGEKRLCIDYRRLNSITIPDRFPLPVVRDLLDRILKAEFISTLDLKSGNWQIALAKGAIPLTAFSTADGHYEFLRLPFGLQGAPLNFSRLMQLILGDLKYVEVYLDDITVHSSTFEDHINHLTTVFDRLRTAKLKLNPDKCTFIAKELKLLGFVVSGKSVKMDPEKVSAIVERMPPKNVKEVQ